MCVYIKFNVWGSIGTAYGIYFAYRVVQRELRDMSGETYLAESINNYIGGKTWEQITLRGMMLLMF